MHLSRLHTHDGASNDFLAQLEGLKAHGYEVFVHSRSKPTNLRLDLVTFEQAKELAHDSNTTVLFHYCGFDKQLAALRYVARGRFIIRYQNVTPPKWFLPYSWRSFAYAYLGRMQIRFFMSRAKIDLLMPASNFSAHELLDSIEPRPNIRVAVVPVMANYAAFNAISKSRPASTGQTKNAIFVSRILPHKGVIHLVKLLESWNRAKPDALLHIHIAGKLAPEYQSYFRRLKTLAKRLNVESQLSFHLDVPHDDLLNLYRMADLYICPSEHEGFGVPLIEAQNAGLPVIVLDRSASSETLGDGGVIVSGEPVDYDKFAQAVASVVMNDDFRLKLIDAGFENIKRFSREKITQSLVESLSP